MCLVSLRHIAIAIALSLMGPSGCFLESSGRTRALRHGDVAPAALARGAFDADVADACGRDVADAASSIMHRHPYLQQVSDRSALLVWTAKREQPMRVTVQRAGGVVPAYEGASDIDPSVPRRGQVLQHVATLDGLEPGTTYCWSLHGDEGAIMAAAGFRTAPAPLSGDAVTFVALGDMGSGSRDQHAVRAQLENVPFDLLLTVGDNAYPNGTLDELERNFFDVYRRVLRSKPVFPTSGNHDYRTADAAPFRQVFALPENGRPAGLERWYSYDFGLVHFVALDTEQIGFAQTEWLEHDLRQNDLPWVIVYAHKPAYSSGLHGSDPRVREVFGPIFARHRVPVVLSGHDHHYERTKPMDGTTYVVTGGGGHSTRPTGASSFTAFSHDVLHFVWGRATPDELELRAVDAAGREFDSFRTTRR